MVTLSLIGGALKICGGIVGGSKSVFVDALTSIANSLAIILVLKFFKASMEPPDSDHHYGHHRLTFGGPISMLMMYSFVAGVIVLDLIASFGRDYKVGYEAPIFAVLATIPYGLAVYVARSRSLTISYARFTTIELIESSTSIASSIGGVAISYIIDYVGAIALSLYLFIELANSFKEIVVAISDVAPKGVIDKILENADKYGLEVHRLRVRKVLENVYQGDMVVRLSSSKPLEEAHNVIDVVEKELRKDGIDVSIHVEPSDKEVKESKDEATH
ncbi:MAG: cation transporter [Candidatus Nezhaarchaeales archaeon]